MTVKISEIYGKLIYSGKGERIGSVKDVVIDVDEGKAERLAIEEMKGLNRRELKKLIKDKTVSYDRVKSVGDIVLLKDIGKKYRETEKGKAKAESSESTEGAFGRFMG